MKKYEIVMSTSFGHKLIIEAKNEKNALKQVSLMGQNEIEEKAEDTWKVDGFQMSCTIEEDA